ncbi:hypothetical protein DMZ43_14270 [Meridianimaribacter sp. CL38]|uniref:Outer membrane protein OmpA-like peptidoglycan-associated protein n=1 Tax=Meridianimaribacter flavus TaxID=571115 RepID=A0ABY2G4T4_9FLAO|nr:OmpA family protein [Meridianimaribacter sp. CL38]TBV25032.1 hypothetical protein DMZ43_14270 [Meridianimaribacter sp. CL38]TDY10205.1 outer membrane protein OmpA-like peptidoglycan-associated protein [Meridianimaribacter flavus]
MRNALYLIISLLFLASCRGTKYNCAELKSIEKIPTETLIKTADSISELRNLVWKEKEEMEKKGIMIDFSFENPVFFEQNCNSKSELKETYHIIGSMIKHEKIKVRIIGNSDSVEIENKPNLSLERAEFIKAIFIKNGIEKNRIEILDAKYDRPFGPKMESGNKENRRVDFEIIAQ